MGNAQNKKGGVQMSAHYLSPPAQGAWFIVDRVDGLAGKLVVQGASDEQNQGAAGVSGDGRFNGRSIAVEARMAGLVLVSFLYFRSAMNSAQRRTILLVFAISLIIQTTL
jgi:hypothetical protein